MHALLRAEMDRLSTDPRHFRLFLEYWTIGVRNAAVRQRIRAALDEYRAAFKEIGAEVVNAGALDQRVIARIRRPIR